MAQLLKTVRCVWNSVFCAGLPSTKKTWICCGAGLATKIIKTYSIPHLGRGGRS